VDPHLLADEARLTVVDRRDGGFECFFALTGMGAVFEARGFDQLLDPRHLSFRL
jgi:hypothetical protein